jgi:Recombinase
MKCRIPRVNVGAGHRRVEYKTVERMKALKASGMGFDRIAATLNEEGFKPRRGTQWFGSAVNKIVSRMEAK